MENYSLDNIDNWNKIYTHWVDRWKELYKDKLENNKWKTCIICDKSTWTPLGTYGDGSRFCSCYCYNKYCKLRESYRAKARNLLKFKTDRVCKYTGINNKTLIEYLEGLFTDGMNWENYGTIWQIDHKIPMAWFDLTNEEEIKCCCNYKNLQTLFTKDNYDKNANIC